jgi:5-methylcytosine-specific restriction endonuclease McrA
VPRLATCEVCGSLTARTDKRCEAHKETGHRSRNRSTVKQRQFRKAVLARDGHRCVRCGATEDLRAAHHPKPLRDYDPDDLEAYNPANGMTFCRRCDRLSDPYAT